MQMNSSLGFLLCDDFFSLEWYLGSFDFILIQFVSHQYQPIMVTNTSENTIADDFFVKNQNPTKLISVSYFLLDFGY